MLRNGPEAKLNDYIINSVGEKSSTLFLLGM